MGGLSNSIIMKINNKDLKNNNSNSNVTSDPGSKIQDGARIYSQFRNKNVLVWGLGLNDGGLGVVEFFLDQDVNLRVTDMKTEKELSSTLEKLEGRKDKIDFVLGEHRNEDFEWTDIIIRSPAIKPDNELLKYAMELKKEVVMDMTLFHKLKPCPSIGITGTRGKSTTTTLISEMFRKKMKDKVFLGGNITVGALRGLSELDKDGLAVLEISSFHLDDMGRNKISPDHSVITNIFTDHLNWHSNRDEYIDSKKNIFKNQKKDGICVLNLDNEDTKKCVDDVPPNAVMFSLKDPSADYYCDGDGWLFEKGNKNINISRAKLQGEHNRYNILAATALCRSLDLDWKYIEEVISEFDGVPHRQEFVKEINGIRFINDTTATSVEAVRAALKRFGPEYKKKIVMISGGMDKGFDYSVLKDDVEKYVKAIVLLEGTGSEKMQEEFSELNIDIHKYFDNFEKAIKEAYRLAEDGDLVILAPGGSSFNMFDNEFDRGRQFRDIVNKLQ